MARYPAKPVPPGYFVTSVELSDNSTGYIAGQVFYGDDDGDGEIIDLVPFRANGYTGLERRLKIFTRRDAAVLACEAHKHNH